MRRIFGPKIDSGIQDQINMVLRRMDIETPSSPEYPKLINQLEQLYGINAKNRRDPVDFNTLALIGGNLFGILVIVMYEQKHVMTSKGLGQILRPRTTGTN